MKRFNTIISVVDTSLITSTFINGEVSITAFASGADLPVGIAFRGTSLLFSVATAITRKSFKLFTERQEKHDTIKLLGYQRHFRYIYYMLAKPITVKLEWMHSWKALGSNIIQVFNFLMRTSYFTKIMYLFIIEIFEGHCEFIIPLLLCSSILNNSTTSRTYYDLLPIY